MRWKEYLEYEKDRDTNVKKIYNKLGMDIDTVTRNSEAQLYTPNKDSNKDVSMWLTRNNKDEEAERVKKLQEISDRNKANIDKVVAESKTKKAGTSNSAGLNPLESENNASKGNKKGLGQIAHDFFIGGIDDDGNDKFMKLFGVDWKAPESQINYQKSQQAKKDSVSNVLNKHGYLEKGSTDEEANEYYSNVMKDMGYSDEDINKSLGFGGEVALNKGFLGKVNSSIRNAVAPGADDVMQMVVNENERNRGSKFGNFASGLVGNTIGLAMNPGGGTAQGTTLLNAADGFAEGVASKVAPKLGNSIAGKVGTNAIRGAVDGGIGGVLDTLRGDDSENLASNIASGALGGALMFGGQKALGEVGNAVGDNIDIKFNALFDDMNGFVKGIDFDNINYSGLKTPFSKAETNAAKIKNKTPRFERTNVDVYRDFDNIKEVGDRSVKLLSNEMGELKPYIKEEASAALRELNDVVKGERFAKYDDVTGENIVTGTQKQVSPTIQAIQNLIPGVSYDKIRKGLNDVIEGKDTSIAKKIELILDDNLSNGRFSGNDGVEFPANQEYKYIKDMYKAMNEGKFGDYLKSQDLADDGKVYVEAMDSETPKRFDNTVKISDLEKKAGPEDNGGTILENGTVIKEVDNASKFANDTVFYSDLAGKQLEDGIMQRGISYDPVTNKETLSNAQKIIDSDLDGAYARIMQEKPIVDAEYMAMGQDLVRRFQNEGRYEDALNVLEKVSKEGSKSGQAIQALSMWRNMTPEGMLAHAQRQINRANAELPKGKQKIELTPDEAEFITGKMKQVQEIPDGREKDILLAEVNKVISNKIPSSVMDKIDSFRYINMLFNPKTLIKNAGGNVVNTTMGNLRDIIATPIDKLVSRNTGERTVGLPNLKEQFRGVVDGVKTVADDYKRGIDTVGDVKEGSNGRAFNNVPVMGEIERLLSAGLKMGDVPFYEAAKNNYLANVMKLNGVDTPTPKMIEDANQAGLEATFQQQTGLGNAISNLKNSKSKPVSIATKTILPFSQTPSAILDTSMNYTPLGVARGAYNLSKGNQRQGVNQLASGILGTGALGLGAGLASSGMMTGSLSDDSETSALQRQAGMQAYALKNGDNYYSIDFAQPAASPLMAGADMANGATLGEMAGTVVNSILDNSYLSGLKDMGETIGEKGFGGAIGEVARNYASQLLPFSALSGQVTRTLDPAIRDTYDTDATQRFINQSMSKYPGLAQILPQGVDTVGEDKYYNEGAGLGERAFRNFITPFNVSTYQPNDVEEKALDIYNTTGETIQMPRYAEDSFSYGGGKSYALTAEEKREYSKALANALRKAPKDAEEMQKAMTRARKEFNEQLKRKHNLK